MAHFQSFSTEGGKLDKITHSDSELYSTYHFATPANAEEDSSGADPPRYVEAIVIPKLYSLVSYRHCRRHRCWCGLLLHGQEARRRQADAPCTAKQKRLGDNSKAE